MGNRTYRCSCLAYVDNSKTTLIIIIAATVGSVLLILVAIVVILILVKKFPSPEKPPTQKEESSRNPMAEKRDIVMNSRQPNVVGRLNSYEMDRVALSPGQYFNSVPRPGYVTRPTTQSGGYYFQNAGNLGYDRATEDGLDKPLRQMYFPYSKNY